MSVKVMTKVFDRYPNGGGEMVLALALADVADDEGQCIYPSISKLATKTRQSERTVQRQLRAMEECGWLIFVRAESRAKGRPREYRISPEWLISPGDKMTPGKPVHKAQNPGDKLTPGPGDKMSPIGCHSCVTRPGDTAVSPDSSYIHKRGEHDPPDSKPPKPPPPHLTATAAWLEVCAALRAGEKPPAWTYPLTEHALREIGGFQALGVMPERQVEFKGNDFKAIFKLRAMGATAQ